MTLIDIILGGLIFSILISGADYRRARAPEQKRVPVKNLVAVPPRNGR